MFGGGFGTSTAPTQGFGSGSSTGFKFGSSPSTTTPSFGGFGTTAAPAFGSSQPAASGGGFGSFGTNPTQPAFGTTAQQPAFGTSTTSGFGTASSSGFNFGGTKSASTPSTGFSFGSAPTAAPTAAGLGFGSASGAPNTGLGFGTTQNLPATFGSTSQPANSGFNFGSSSTTQPSTGFGSFGQTPATTAPSSGFGVGTGGFGGFGTAAPSSGFGFGTGFGAPAGSLGFGAQPQQPAAEPVNFDTSYKDLPPNYKAEVDRTFNEFKKPMRLGLEEISRANGKVWEDLREELQKMQLTIIQVENQQVALQYDIKPFLEEVKQVGKDVRIHGTIGMEQIKSRYRQGAVVALSSGGGSSVFDETLPNKFYYNMAEQLEKRLQKCIDDIRYFSRQLQLKMGRSDELAFKGPYGQAIRIGTQQVLEIMRYQNDAFVRITASVAAVHHDLQTLKELYLRWLRKREPNAPDPFEAADKKELTERRLLEQKMRSEAIRAQMAGNAAAPLQVTQGQTSSVAPTLSFGNSAFGGAVAGAPSFSAPAATTAVQFGNNTSFAAPITSAAPTSTTGGLGGFGLSSTSGGGKTLAGLDLATPPATTAFGTSGGFGGFGTSTTTGGLGGFGASSTLPSSSGFAARKGKSKK